MELSERIERIEKHIADGKKVADALKAEHMSPMLYYKNRKAKKKGSAGKAKASRPGRHFVDLPMKTAQTNVAVVVCQPDQLKSVLQALQ